MALEPAIHEKGVDSGTITKSSNLSSGSIDFATCYKKDDVVSVSGRISSIPAGTKAWGNFMNVPSGFRPPTRINVMGFLYSSGTGRIITPLGIKTDGDVELFYSQNVEPSEVYFCGTYKI